MSDPKEATIDDLIADIESRGLGWMIDHMEGRRVTTKEARVWDFPHCLATYRTDKPEPLATMLAKAMYDVDWTKYPKLTQSETEQ